VPRFNQMTAVAFSDIHTVLALVLGVVALALEVMALALGVWPR